MRVFDYRMLPWNVEFGAASLERLPGLLDDLEFSKAMILTTAGQAPAGRRLRQLLGARAVGHFDKAAMHVPAETVGQARQTACNCAADCTVSIGGGSTTGLGKALALRAGLANIAIPTTYAGSEMTNIWGITDAGRKVTGRDNAVLPNLTLYDPQLTLALPGQVSACSGMNALAQAVANVSSDDAAIVSLAMDAIRVINSALPIVVEQPDNGDARSDLLWGACLAGAALGAGTTGLHHKLCHILGGTFGTAHAETHAVLLPYTVAFTATADKATNAAIAAAMNETDAAIAIHRLARSVGAPTSLRQLGIDGADLARVLAIAMAAAPGDAAPHDEREIAALLERALHGREPPRSC